MKKFNINGPCDPDKHFMVDITGKVEKIKTLVDKSAYLIIDKPPKSGKTTILTAVEKIMRASYKVISIDANCINPVYFESENKFCAEFIRLALDSMQLKTPESKPWTELDNNLISMWDKRNEINNLNLLDEHIKSLCIFEKPVLIIDNVNTDIKNKYKVFSDFIEMLKRQQESSLKNMCDIFQSIILAGVFDTKDKKAFDLLYNSPLDLPIDFEFEMSFRSQKIKKMLDEYETEYNTGMDTFFTALKICRYSGGHPLLVSKICKCIDEKFDRDWSLEGIQKAVELINIYAAHGINSFV